MKFKTAARYLGCSLLIKGGYTVDMLSYEEMAAEYSNVPPATFRKWKSKGLLKPVEYVGRSPRFNRVDVEKCVQNHKPELNGNPARLKKLAAAKSVMTLEFEPVDDSETDSNFQYTNGQPKEDKNMEADDDNQSSFPSEDKTFNASDDGLEHVKEIQADNVDDTNGEDDLRDTDNPGEETAADIPNSTEQPAPMDDAKIDSEASKTDNKEISAPTVTVESPPFKMEDKTLEQRAETIRQLIAGVGYNMIQVGLELVAAKKQCGHGHWAQWINENCHLSQRQANTFMRIAVRFGDAKSEDIMRFGLYTVDAMLALPAGKVDKFIETQAAAGKPIEEMTVNEVKKAVKQFNREVKGVYTNITGKPENDAVVDELNHADSGAQKAHESVPNVETVQDEKICDESAADDKSNPLKEKEADVQARVENFARAVKNQLEDVRLLAEISTDLNAIRTIRATLKIFAQSVDSLTSSLNTKIKSLVEADMPVLPGMDK